LPGTFEECFGAAWSSDERRFPFQETYIIDFKERVPTKFAEGYGAGFVRLALAFYNTFGGLIVIGINDREQTPVGLDAQFNVEGFNRFLSDLTAHPIETIYREYLLPGSNSRIGVILVPKRDLQRPAILNKIFDKYAKGTLWIRDRHQVKEADSHNLPLIYSRRETLPSDHDSVSNPIHKALPPTPSTI
jgi:predicted HTH transcriptional regulator